MWSRSQCEQGRGAAQRIRRLRVRGDFPCRRGRAVAVDHLPMAKKEEGRLGL